MPDELPLTVAQPAKPREDATRTQSPDTRPADGTTARIFNDSIPEQLPGYDILGKLGEGGMGEVFLAREPAFDRDVAIKVLKARYAAHPAAVRRFLEEARITAQLQHPAIPPVHHIGTLADGRPFLAMKLIKGDTLADLLEREPANRNRFIAPFAQVCQALAYAHSRKVIHRDLKPGNVMIGAFGEVQVMDWGLAKVLNTGREQDITADAADEATEIRMQREPDLATQAGSVMGTPAYMAPEQAAGEIEKIDQLADVFGLGAILCAILTGKPPYSGPTSDSIRLRAIRGDTADAFARLDASDADPDLIATCKRCLDLDRDYRPRDADEVAKAITGHLAAAEERARQAELDRVRAEESRKRRRVQLILAASVVLLLAFTGVGVGLAKLWSDAEEARDGERRQRIAAQVAKRQVEDARDGEKKSKNEVRYLNYAHAVDLAHREYQANNVARARELLESCPEDLRLWEWRYVHRRCNAELTLLKGHADEVVFAAFSRDGSHVVANCRDRALVWDVETGNEVTPLEHLQWIQPTTLTRDGRRRVSSTKDNSAEVRDADTGKQLALLKGHTGYVCFASFSEDGRRVVTASLDKTARVWDAETGKELSLLKGHIDRVVSSTFSSDGRRIVTASEDRTVRVWDSETGKEHPWLRVHVDLLPGPASFSNDGRRVFTTSATSQAQMWNAETGEALAVLKGHTDSLVSGSFSGNGRSVVTASNDRTARVWEVETGRELVTLKGHSEAVVSASFSRDGLRVVTASEDKSARVWEVETGKELANLQGHSAAVVSASFSGDGRRIVTASVDKTARVWDAKTSRELALLKGHTMQVLSVSFSADSRHVATASLDKTARLWDADTGKELAILNGHTTGVLSALFSSDGSRLVTASWDETARVWDTKTGKLMLTLPGHTGPLRYAAFSEDDAVIRTIGLAGNDRQGSKSIRMINYDTRPARETFRKYLEAPPPRAKP